VASSPTRPSLQAAVVVAVLVVAVLVVAVLVVAVLVEMAGAVVAVPVKASKAAELDTRIVICPAKPSMYAAVQRLHRRLQ